MKKRAQVPDSRTFTILFRGFADHPQYPNSLDRALSMYQSMSAENCPVKPSIIHTNAVLNVCARFMDVDALLGVAAKLPTRGAMAPNNITFTTIINAIRTATLSKGGALSDDEKRQSQQTAVSQGRSIWGEVRDRWQNRDIEVDEAMVCAMGRLLLLGSVNRDCYDVLSLLEQTMGIPRQVPRLENRNEEGMSDRSSRDEQATKSTPEPEKLESDGWTGEEAKELTASQSPSGMVEREDEDDVSGNEFDAIGPGKIEYVHPGHNTLSMVMDACIALKAFSAAQDYWGLLTDPAGHYKITPDADNYHVYLRLLRRKRASKHSVEMLEELSYNPPGGIKVVQPKTFRIAMSTCLRDVNNPNVLTHANKMARIMLDSFETPDVRALGMYLSLALTDRHLQWEPLMPVLRGCEIGARNLRSFLAYGEKRDIRNWKGDQKAEVIRFVSRLARAFQTAMSLGKGRMSFEEEKFCKVQGHKLSEWALRMQKMDRVRGRWQEKRSTEEGMERGQEEEKGRGGNSDKVTPADGSTERVDAVDGDKHDQGAWSRWNMFRYFQRPSRNERPADVVSTDDPPSSEAKMKRFLGSNYRPSSIYNYRNTLAHQNRMQRRSAEARQRLRERAAAEEEW